MSNQIMTCPSGLSPLEQDIFWMEYAYQLADRAEAIGEVPVGAVLVKGKQRLSEGWNQSIMNHDPTAHAEIIALRLAGKVLENYRLIDTVLYVTLEPCPMCASAMVHARVARVVYGAADGKTGAAGSVFNLVDNVHLNHQISVHSGVMAEKCSTQISTFFKKRRKVISITKIKKYKDESCQ